ncbi:hypothetical protein BVRB_8g201620 [Beta vulgaris subsp. vulgaris]|uniref:Uncharacterized protein n=1 Tax=Beta vulgaris subsp. vulgaris TaxID=3555 RepID=A0A0J8B9R2_BETVV|nr:hypothetical protein BVRB_8g201620 [Beta vulgaris subsp. vulgaris]
MISFSLHKTATCRMKLFREDSSADCFYDEKILM